jgi:hypothetical protein
VPTPSDPNLTKRNRGFYRALTALVAGGGICLAGSAPAEISIPDARAFPEHSSQFLASEAGGQNRVGCQVVIPDRTPAVPGKGAEEVEACSGRIVERGSLM